MDRPGQPPARASPFLTRKGVPCTSHSRDLGLVSVGWDALLDACTMVTQTTAANPTTVTLGCCSEVMPFPLSLPTALETGLWTCFEL